MAKIKIVCLGDSTTFGFPYGHQDSWVKMLSDEIFGEVLNKGINGNTTSDMLERFDKAVIANKPDYVIITGGINDVVCGESQDRIKQNIMDMVEKALAHGIIPVLGIPTPVDYVPWERSLQKLRMWMREYAENLNIAIIDFSKAFFDSEGNIKTELLLDDGGHPSREGYKQMFNQIDLSIFNIEEKESNT